MTWALEHRAWRVACFSRFWDPNYYRTYNEEAGQSAGYMSVQQEVTRALANRDDFHDVPGTLDSGLKSSAGGLGTMASDERPAFVVEDEITSSARWPGDVHTFAKRFSTVLHSSHPEVGPPRR